MTTFRRALAAAAALALGACAAPQVATNTQVAAGPPIQWQAPLPHNGSLSDLSAWWKDQGDALLVQLIEAAQTVSPSLAAARSRIAQSRAERVAGAAALWPALDAAASVNRTSRQSELPMGTISQAALQASWELDLFGARRATRNAAQARLEGAQAGWHEARVSLAAEVASLYYGLRGCEQLLAIALQDATSRADSARLTELSANAGFQPPASAALARASAAEAAGRAIAQRAACDLDLKGLVALSALPEPHLRQRLAADGAAPIPPMAIGALPARTLSQRPDVFAFERAVSAASADVGSARAQRYPRLSLSGSVGVASLRSGGVSTTLDTWSIGPLALSVPLFDAGRRSANLDAAAARYDEAVIQYRAGVRQAVREVEQALVNLDSTQQRGGHAHTALAGYRDAFDAAEARHRNGFASLFELEDARRTRLAAENTVASLQRERNAAWIALYRAAGGGWTAAAKVPTVLNPVGLP